MDAFKDFISREKREFPVQIGKHVASSLSGFIAGAIVTTILWVAAFYLSTAVR